MTDKNQTFFLRINIYLVFFNVVFLTSRVFDTAGDYYTAGIVIASFLLGSVVHDIADSAKVLIRFNVPIFLLLLALMVGQVIRHPAFEHGTFMPMTLLVAILAVVSVVLLIALQNKYFRKPPES